MNNYIEYILTLYKDKKISRDVTLSLMEKFKGLSSRSKEGDSSVSVVGLACRMPMADSKDEYWEHLKNGINCVRQFPEHRRQDTNLFISHIAHQLKNVKQPYWRGGFLSEVDRFDNEFFRIMSPEAALMDPQQRIFLEVAYTAFADAGYTIEQLRGSNTGVFIGDVVNEYRKIVAEVSPRAVTGNVSPFIGSRVSYFYDLHGPTINVSTTCSTGLVAVHMARQALLAGECDVAIVGASNLRLFPFAFVDDPVDALGITTEEEFCYAFDERACGIVRGEGVGALVLKRTREAMRDKNHIYAQIRGSGVNNDGRSPNVGAPNPLAQAALLKSVWEESKFDPTNIGYIETHGTGTRIGDPIEVQGISAAFSSFTSKKQFCGIGSVKTNLGHITGGASGLAGLIKTILALHHEFMPPSLHFKRPNALINFADTPVYVVDRLMPWSKSTSPRFAGVSAFGFNGTNCHIVLEEAPTIERGNSAISQPLPFLFTHKSLEGLTKQIQSFILFLEEYSNISLLDMSYTLGKGRDHFHVQTLVYASSLDELIHQLKSPIVLREDPQPLSWGDIFQFVEPRLISLPTHIFEAKRFWLESPILYEEDQSFKKSESDVPPPVIDRDDIEGSLLKIFREVLSVDANFSDSFFDLGGDSLIGVEIINLIHKRLDKKISYSDLFDHPRISDLAEVLTTKQESFFASIPSAPIARDYPLSYGQRRLWILHQMQDNPTAYNIYATYQFDANINIDKFKSAMNQLVSRHDGLRSLFFERDGEPRQKIFHPNDSNPIDRELPNFCREFSLITDQASSYEEAWDKIYRFRDTPFDLETGPLAAGLLITLSSDCYLFFFMMHHIISDGWSVRIIIEELVQLYRGDEKRPLSISPVDYCHWQRQRFSEEHMYTLRSYWQEYLKKPIPICEIPGDKPRPKVFTFEGARRKIAISKQLEEMLVRRASSQNATLFMTLLSSIYVLIYFYSRQTDILVGSPISGRTHADLERLVGFFVNTVILRCTLDPEGTFSELLQQVRTDTLQSFEHQEYPFDLLVDELHLDRDTSRSPLFNINVAFQNFELDLETKQALSILKAKHVDIHHHSCKWDLEFEFVKDHNGELSLFIEYYRGIYSEEMVNGLMDTYQRLLAEVATDLEHPINDLLRCCTEDICIKGPDHYYPFLALHQSFERQALSTPDRKAIEEGNRALTYSELNKQANQLAHFLLHVIIPRMQTKSSIGKELGGQQEEETLVGIYMENSIESIVSLLAVLKAGAAYVPLDPKAPLERTIHIIDTSPIHFVLSKKKYLRTLNELQWSSSLHAYLCLDSSNINDEIEQVSSGLMNDILWNQVAIEGDNQIASSGWVSSYTGEAFSDAEMEEYVENVLHKMRPYLTADIRVLEVGCGSGLTAFALAPHVGYYLAVDLSSEIIRKNQDLAREKGLSNIEFDCFAADQVDQLSERDFDLVILNSVIHCFPGTHYLKHVIKKIIGMVKREAVLFLGDLMDRDLKKNLEQSLYDYKAAQVDRSVRTKVDWKEELFISRDFLSDLQIDFPSIVSVESTKKLGSIENELVQFRFDALCKIIQTDCTQSSDISSLSIVAKKKVQYDVTALTSRPDDNVYICILPTTLAYVLFTSGSTGQPKGVMVEHFSVHNYVSWAINYYQSNRFVCPFYSPLHFDLTVTSIFLPLFTGGEIRVFQGEFDEILEQLSLMQECTLIKLTPSHLDMLLELNRKLPGIQQFIIGGETLYSSQALALQNLYDYPVKIYNEYGPTETTVGCAVHEWKRDQDYLSVLIGTPIANCCMYILNDELQSLPVGAIGEIVIEGHGLARGYLNDPLLTDKKFITHGKTLKYLTGDLGQYLPSGELAYIGRKDRQIKLRGYRVELDEVEARLMAYPLIDRGSVVVKTTSSDAIVLCAYYVSKEPISKEEIEQFLARSLPSYMVPSFYRQIDEMPMTRNGKVDTARLPLIETDQQTTIVLPQNGIETELFEIWSQVLNVPIETLSTDHDFFDLGGDSIIATRILSQMREIGWIISMKTIFQWRTIRAISQHVQRGEVKSSEEGPITGTIPWTPIQKWFWSLELPHPEYFTMAYMFALSEDTDVAKLQNAFFTCFEHHDVLRVFCHGDVQYIGNLTGLVFAIDTYDLSEETDQEKAVLLLTERIQDSFKLHQPPLVKAAIFDLGTNGKRLFITIHHLVIDGVSWRYLVEDLAAAYVGIPLPPKTRSYQSWAVALETYSVRDSDIVEWLEMSSSESQIFGDGITTQSVREMAICFSQEETRLLMKHSRSFFDANVNEILLAALALSLYDVFDRDEVLIHHEGHGRDSLNELDVTRTCGWFTTIFPLVLEKKADVIATLVHVKEKLLRLQGKELAFLMAKYSNRHPHLHSLHPEILFNYFGRVDENVLSQRQTHVLKNCEQTIASTSHRDNSLPHALEINGIVIEDCLRLSIVYRVDSAVIMDWLPRFKERIIDFVKTKEKIICF